MSRKLIVKSHFPSDVWKFRWKLRGWKTIRCENRDYISLVFARECTFVKYYLPRTIARWSLIISWQIAACKNNDAAITMERALVSMSLAESERWINRWYTSTGHVSTCRYTFQTTWTKRLPRNVIGDKRRPVKIYIRFNCRKQRAKI